jgi:hypothetical protein
MVHGKSQIANGKSVLSKSAMTSASDETRRNRRGHGCKLNPKQGTDDPEIRRLEAVFPDLRGFDAGLGVRGFDES